MMKRGREEMEMEMNMAKCLMLLSQRSLTTNVMTQYESIPGRVFACKTCDRIFPSFQALGGHRASHKKHRLMEGDGDMLTAHNGLVQSKPKTHECSICGLEFAIGQALGGHMRRHRPTIPGDRKVPAVLKRSNSSRRVVCLDLNLTPMENGLEFNGFSEKINFRPPVVHCFI
ncbi:hypothetical protein GIB67_037550 [Kingdonia uniflora]|uniref:C2H2-type domain-containing protein n=1 Tax=Kingdonia uniflora TaxID=39325 RepID=A0A7J7NBB8_9MAGN|nr:hypothetical protein GIB67_037550 [Kingdonia uniflora]